MKGGGVSVSSYQISTKRRWKGFVIAVLGLVILSMLVPLVFLLGFHNGFHSSGFPSEQQSTPSDPFEGYDSRNSSHTKDKPTKSDHIDELLERLRPVLPKEHVESHIKTIPLTSGSNGSSFRGHVQVDQRDGRIAPPAVKSVQKSPPASSTIIVNHPEVVSPTKGTDESEVSCELRYGSYCLWRRKNREVMRDSMVKKMKDRLFVARAYFPSIAKLPAHERLSRELRQNIQDFERILSESTTDVDLPSHTTEKLQKMEAVIAKAKSIPVDCNNVDKKFRQLVDLTEDEANFHTKQSAFLYQLAVQTMPKSLHCLTMRLTVEYFTNSSIDLEVPKTEKFVDPDLFHYAIFSSNILASSVAINSTVEHAKESKKLVFHVLTDKENFYAMKLWFLRNKFKDAAVQVLNVEDFKTVLNPNLALPEEFRVTFQVAQQLPKMQYNTEYLSSFSHSHYLLPEIFKDLDKIVVLDDDMLVQQELSALWRINMGKKVNGAIEMCSLQFGQLSSYLGRNILNNNACPWMSGLNVIDLARWRELNLTGKFQKYIQEVSMGGRQSEAAASRASLLTFQDLVHVLDDTWVLSGLGHDYELDAEAIKNSAALHYNGNMKPWLELGIPKYKSLWIKFLSREDSFLSECNVNP